MVAGQRHISPLEPADKRPDKYSEQRNPEHYTKQVQRPEGKFISQHKVISFILIGMILADMLFVLCYNLFIEANALQ